MGLELLGSRAIIGSYYTRLAQDLGATWIPLISNYFTSDQESETYRWMGQVPQMRQWIGGRQAKGSRVQGFTIHNQLYEATLEFLLDEMRRDKTGQILIRIGELAARTNSHWAKLLASLISNGAAQVCYDGQYFFDTDHAEGNSGTQSNSLTYDMAGSAPTAAEFAAAIMAAITGLVGFLDDQGEPMNENANQFLVLVGPQHLQAAATALAAPVVLSAGQSSTNILATQDFGGFKISLAVSARLAAFGQKFLLFRTDGQVKPFIRQEEEGVKVDAIAEGSELEFRERKHQYGVHAIRNVGYGIWQGAVLTTLT
jgi:phage major head subunit gpT-like protein